MGIVASRITLFYVPALLFLWLLQDFEVSIDVRLTSHPIPPPSPAWRCGEGKQLKGTELGQDLLVLLHRRRGARRPPAAPRAAPGAAPWTADLDNSLPEAKSGPPGFDPDFPHFDTER